MLTSQSAIDVNQNSQSSESRFTCPDSPVNNRPDQPRRFRRLLSDLDATETDSMVGIKGASPRANRFARDTPEVNSQASSALRHSALVRPVPPWTTMVHLALL